MAIGPVQLLVLGFDEPNFQGEALAQLRRLGESGVVRLVDLLVVRKDEDGNIERLRHTDLDAGELAELGATVGALIGLGAGGEEADEVGAILGAAGIGEGDGPALREEDFWYVDDAIPPGSAAAVALLEHRWAIELRDAVRGAGGTLLADAWVHPADLVAIGLLAAEEVAAY